MCKPHILTNQPIMGRPNREILTGGKRYKDKKLKNRVQEVVFDKDKRKDYLTGFHKRKLERKKKAQEYLEEEAKKQRLEERARIREERKLEVQRKLAEMKEARELNPFLDNSSSESESDNEEEGDDDEKREVKFSDDIEGSDDEWNGFDQEGNEDESKESKKNGKHSGILKKQIYNISNEDAPVSGTSEVVIETLDNPNKVNFNSIASKMNVDLDKADEVLNGSIARAKKYARLMGMSDSPKDATAKASKPKKKKFRYLSKTERKVNNMKIKDKAYKRRNKDRD